MVFYNLTVREIRYILKYKKKYEELRKRKHEKTVVGILQPIPESGTKIEPVMKILRLNEHIRIQQIRHHITSNSCANLSKVSLLETPSMA